MINLAFRSAFKLAHKLSGASCGSDMIRDYSKSFSDSGEVQIKFTERNLTDEINAQVDACNLDNMMRRASLGDDSALIQRDELMYYDTVGLPKNIIEANAFIEKAKLEFASLPLEVRKEFDNNVEEYARQYGSKEFGSKLDKFFNPPKVAEPASDSVVKKEGDSNE